MHLVLYFQTLSSFESFLIGGFAKAVATVITYPLQLVQCRLRVCIIQSIKILLHYIFFIILFS